MRTVAFYRQKASDCREMARQISLNEPRDQLLKMARDWEELAVEREAELRRRSGELPEITDADHCGRPLLAGS